MKESFHSPNNFEDTSLENESVDHVMEPPEGPLQELLPIHFTADHVEAVSHMLSERGFPLDALRTINESYALNTIIPLITEYLEIKHPRSKESREEDIIEALKSM